MRKKEYPAHVVLLWTIAIFLIFSTRVMAKQVPQDSVLRDSEPFRPYVIDGNSRVDAESGVILAMYRLKVPATDDDPVIAAKQFLESRAADFGGVDVTSGLKLIAVKESPAGTTVHFQQTVSEIPVHNAMFSVTIDKDRLVRMVLANPYPDLKLPSFVSSYSAARAVDLTREHLRDNGPDMNEPYTELAAFRDRNGNDHLAWIVRLVSNDPMGDWEVIWDAVSGKHIETVDHTCYVDGTGMIFNPDPLTTAEVNYGGQYADNNDADTNELNDEREEAVLPDILNDNGVYRLEGPYVEIMDFESPTVTPVVGDAPDDFFYTRSQSGFEDVNVYYHIDNAQRHLQALGFMDIQNGPIWADPHGVDGEDNSHYLPWVNRLAFGEGGVDDAEDADIVYHEYGHAIQHDQVPNWGGGHTGAMGEGFSDYWAGTFSARISDYHDTWFANWDGHNPFWGGRILDYFGVYPDNWTGQIHQDGQIWSSCLWNIRGQVGADDTDAIVIQAHYFLGFGATVEDGAEALLLADDLLFDGANAAVIGLACYEKGFLENPPQTSAIEGTVLDIADEEPIAGAQVLLDGELVASTNGEGFFSIENLGQGTYDLCVEAVGYSTWCDEVELGFDEVLQLTIHLSSPLLTVEPAALDLSLQVDDALDTTLTLSNEGSGEAAWRVRFRPAGLEPPEPWTVDEQIDLLDMTGDPYIFGVTVFNGFIVASGANGNDEPNIFYLLDSQGWLVDQVEQPSTSAFGYMDLATDDSLIYGSEGEWIVGMDLDGTILDSIPGPLNYNRALAYDPGNDWFWCSDVASDIVAIDREGVIQAQYGNDLYIQGLAWYPYDGDGMPLYLTSRTGEPGNALARILKMNPESGEFAVVADIAQDNESNMALGMEISNQLDGLEDYWVSPVVILNLTGTTARVDLHLLDTSVPNLGLAPVFGALQSQEEQVVTLSVNALNFETGNYDYDLDFVYNGPGGTLALPLSLLVTSVSADEAAAELPIKFEVEPAFPNPFNLQTKWTVRLPSRSPLSVQVFNLLGREVSRLDFNSLDPGTHTIAWKAPAGLSSGVYYVRFTGEAQTMKAWEKILLLK